MQVHNLKRKTKNKKSAQVGRGGTRGKTSGRGTKGQNARAGHKKRPELRDFIKRIPKLRGRGKNMNKANAHFAAGAKISTSALAKKGLLATQKGRLPQVKIVGGTTDKKFSLVGITASASVKVSIEKAGGTIVG